MNQTWMILCRLTVFWLALGFAGTGCKCSGSRDTADARALDSAVVPEASAAPTLSKGGPFLWRIAGEKPSFLFGTIHVPDDRVKVVPIVERALDASETVQTEIPMDTATQLKMAPMLMLGGGKTLKQVLPADVWGRLEKRFASHQLPIEPMIHLKVWVISVQVAVLDRLLELAARRPIDAVLFDRAQRAGKKVGGLETVEEQVAVFDGMSMEEQIHGLRETLDQLDKAEVEQRDPVGELLAAYVAGDDAKLLAAIRESYDPNDPRDQVMMKRVFTDRNVRMADRIVRTRETDLHHSHFFAVGAGHLVGADGLVALLRARGLEVTRVTE